MRRALIAGCLLVLAAAPTGRNARAQSCWPVAVLLEVRDADGERMDSAELDSVVTLPVRRGPDGRGRVPPARVSAPYTPAPDRRDPAHLLQWSQAGCRLQIDSVTLYRGGEAMRLDLSVMLDSERRGGPSTFVIEAPPFRPGTYRLRWDPMEPGGSDDSPQRLEAERWTPEPPCEDPP